jgi:hypothetical protein
MCKCIGVRHLDNAVETRDCDASFGRLVIAMTVER